MWYAIFGTSRSRSSNKQAELVSRELIKSVEKDYKVVTLTASCGLMLKFEWPLLMPNDGIIKKLSQNTLDIDELSLIHI